jgi:catechol 2,3-dioxygenase-like lactoylglutathione lyase family enzyme
LITGFHHTGIVVRDLDRMVRFYTEDLGLELLLELDSVAPPGGDHTGVPGAKRKLVFVGKDGGHQIELVHYLEPAASDGYLDKHQFGAMHVCFNVDDVQQAYETLREKGVRFATEPKFSETPEKGRIGIVYCQDPEGNWLEFIQWPHASQKEPRMKHG